MSRRTSLSALAANLESILNSEENTTRFIATSGSQAEDGARPPVSSAYNTSLSSGGKLTQASDLTTSRSQNISSSNSSDRKKILFGLGNQPESDRKVELMLLADCDWEVLCSSVLASFGFSSKSHRVLHFVMVDSDGDVLSPNLSVSSKFWKFYSKYRIEDSMLFMVYFDKSPMTLVESSHPPQPPNAPLHTQQASGNASVNTNDTSNQSANSSYNDSQPTTSYKKSSVTSIMNDEEEALLVISSLDRSDSNKKSANDSNYINTALSGAASATGSKMESNSNNNKSNNDSNQNEKEKGVIKGIKVRLGKSQHTFNIHIPVNCPWDEILCAITAGAPLLKKDWIQALILVDSEGDELSPALRSGSKFWKIGVKFRPETDMVFKVVIDEGPYSKALEDAAALEHRRRAKQQAEQVARGEADMDVKVRLAIDKSRIGFAKISTKLDWDAIKAEISQCLGLVTGNRIKFLVLIDGDGEDISAHLTTAAKFIGLCTKVYNEEAKMVFDVYLFEQPKPNACTLGALFSYTATPSPHQNFHSACIAGDIVTCRRLVLHGVDIMTEDSNGMSAIHLASLGGHLEVVKWLISLKIPVDQVDRNYMTPLHHACDGMHASLALVLVDAGASLLAKNSFGLTPLHYICLRGLIELSNLLRPYTVNLASSSGLTCLHCACDGGHEEMTLHLLSIGGHVDARDFEGMTPLHYACLSGE